MSAGGRPGTPAPEHASAGWPDRSFAIAGVVVAGAVAAWWLGSSRLALDHGTDAGRSAGLALSALWLVRGVALAVTGIRAGALYGWRPAVHAGLALIAPSWPVVALAWSAGTAPATLVALAELSLLAASAALPAVGFLLTRLLRRAELAIVVGTAGGTTLAAALWFVSAAAWMPLPR